MKNILQMWAWALQPNDDDKIAKQGAKIKREQEDGDTETEYHTIKQVLLRE